MVITGLCDHTNPQKYEQSVCSQYTYLGLNVYLVFQCSLCQLQLYICHWVF